MSGTQAGIPEPFLTTNYRETDASFSPDGATVVFGANREGRFDLYSGPRPAAAPIS